ncbi:MAG: hypothetical protein ABR548_02635 [Actinomycetota bacterium]|nr:hypothetical protein [Actinomycetota bacterium]
MPKRAAADPKPQQRRRDEVPSDRIEFAHESEREYARLLDFYQIEWQYEPRSFDIDWDADGNVLKQFTPDFYLPAYDLYIEVTTMNQKLVTKKNRKVRRLRELYPGVKIKIFYQRDYVALLKKYGLEGSGDAMDAPPPDAKSPPPGMID